VGYYVNNEYADEALREAPPASVAIERVTRNILAEKPRVTRFPIAFDAAAIPSGAALEQQGGFGAEPQFGGGGSSVGFGAAAAFGGGSGSMGLGGVEAGQEGGEAMMMMS
jgi:histone chaperone ASF1